MKILAVTQLKPIQVRDGGFLFPLNPMTRIVLDKKSPSHKKEHQLIFQQGSNYGSVGDCCNYLSNEDLFTLERKGMISIKKSSS